VQLGTDRIRKEFASLSPDKPAAAPYQEGIYTPDWTETRS
jgi:hypothetical protein